MREEKAVEPLIRALNDKYIEVRIEAIIALGKIKSNKAVEPLIQILQGRSNEEIRAAAAYALGEIRNDRTIEPLRKALKIEVDLVCKQIALSLDKFGEHDGKEQLVSNRIGEESIYSSERREFPEIYDRKKFEGIFLICLFAVFMFVCLYINIYHNFKTTSSISPFYVKISDYINISGLKFKDCPPYIKGKVITVNKTRKSISDIYLRLPSRFHSQKPEDVTTVIWVDYFNQVIGNYSPVGYYSSVRSKAYVKKCKITIIDKTIPAVVGTKVFSGSLPPKTKIIPGPGYGSEVNEMEIVNYLKKLPIK